MFYLDLDQFYLPLIMPLIRLTSSNNVDDSTQSLSRNMEKLLW